MIINGDGGYGLMAAYIGGLAAQAGWLGRLVGFKGRLDKHWKEFMFSLELPPRTVTSCH